MRAHELVQLAALVAVHGPMIVRSRLHLPAGALDTFWAASKCRQERWATTLKAASALAPAATEYSTAVTGLDALGVMDEILTTEVLSRVWVAVCVALDRFHGRDEAGPIANSVFIGHLEARHRVLNGMVYGHGLSVEEAVGLNRRRLRNERWTDLLLSMLGSQCDVQPYVFDPRRVEDWARGVRGDRGRAREITSSTLLLTTLTAAYRDARLAETSNEDLNRRIAASVVACLPLELFDSLGCPASPLVQSLLRVCPDMQGKLNLPPGATVWLRHGRR